MSRIDLNALKIASPCNMSWDKMKGGDRVRHCGECKLNVYNLAELSNDEAQALIAKAAQGKRVCMRLSRRSDGTVITQDCPVGLKIARRMKLKLAALRLTISAAVLGVFGLPAYAASIKITGVSETGDGSADKTTSHRLMGKIALPQPQPTQKGQHKPPQSKPPKQVPPKQDPANPQGSETTEYKTMGEIEIPPQQK